MIKGLAKQLYFQFSCTSTIYDKLSSLTAISPIDGRYYSKAKELNKYFSEAGLIKYRIQVEIEWLKFLCKNEIVKSQNQDIFTPTQQDLDNLTKIYSELKEDGIKRVKEIEKTTNHDVKAVEYYIKEQLSKSVQFDHIKEYVHFCCTSEDINNLSYAMMLRDGNSNVVLQTLKQLQKKMVDLSKLYAATPMLSRTHGQVASPTTVGKEFANFTYRMTRQLQQIERTTFFGKMNGAVGNFNAHLLTYPEYNWPQLSQKFTEHLGLVFNPYSTQIEPHDFIAELYNSYTLLNTILIGFSNDMWNYISIGYFKQKTKKHEIGSSTMPHKVNPIDYENCEGNLNLANSLMQSFIRKLPISRFQRDLSDSTVMRNHGVALGYSIIGYQSLLIGLNKVDPNVKAIANDLEKHQEVLAEPIQMVMRKYNLENPYELLKGLTRGKENIQRSDLDKLINESKLPQEEKDRLIQLKPSTYTGNAQQMASEIENYLKKKPLL